MKIKILVLLFVVASSSNAQLKIESGAQLTVVNGGMLYSNEAVANNGTITLNTGRLLLANNFNNSSVINAADATIELVGGNTQSLSFGNNDIAKRLELNKTNNTATVTAGKLTITDGFKSVAGTFNAGEKVVLKSTSTKTAIVEQSTAGTVTNMVVERYIPAKRAYRLLSSPVTSTTSIKYNWQENQSNTSPVFANNSDTASGYGTHIAGSTTGANGFDATQSGSPSLFQFDNASQAWTSITNTDTNTLNVGEGYRLMVRGDRSIDMNTNTPSPTNTTLRTKGTLKIGTHTVTGLSSIADAYNFIGNPYQSPVDIETVLTSSTNVNPNYYYVWDPKVGGTNGRGAYVTYSFLTDSNNVSGSAVDAFLQPMQACFVKTATNAATSVVFQEANKTTTTNENVYKNANSTLPILQLNLFDVASFTQGNTALDGVMCVFGSNFSNNLDAFDAEKLTNLDENMSVLVENNKQSIASYNLPNENTVYPLNITNYRTSNYMFTASVSNYEGLTPYLHDTFLNSFTPVTNNLQYAFSVNADNAISTAANRFKIVFSNQVLHTPEFDVLAQVTIYPNPAKTSEFNIVMPSFDEKYEVALFNDLGQKIAINQINKTESGARCVIKNTLAQGIYHIVIKTNTGDSVVKKWVIN